MIEIDLLSWWLTRVAGGLTALALSGAPEPGDVGESGEVAEAEAVAEPAVDPQFDVTGISVYNLPPAPVVGCEATLEAAGVKFKPAPLTMHWNRSREFLCGAKQVLRYQRGPTAIRYSTSPRLTCTAAVALLKFEAIVQEEAERVFGRKVVAIEQMGTYNCRSISAYPDWVSQHSFAHAIDIKRFTLQGGRDVSVQKHYGRGPDIPAHKEGQFLRAVARRIVQEQAFNVVLTPNFDRAHHNHFHLDMASYTVDGT